MALQELQRQKKLAAGGSARQRRDHAHKTLREARHGVPDVRRSVEAGPATRAASANSADEVSVT